MEKKQGQTRIYLKSRRLLIIIMGLTKEISNLEFVTLPEQ